MRISGKSLQIALTMSLVLVMIELFRLGVADFMRLEPAAYLDAIRASNARPSPDKLAEARDRLLAARTLDPENPIIPEYLGQVSFYQAMLASADARSQKEFFLDALVNYEAAIMIRPNSGYLWASLMLTRQALLDLAHVTDMSTNTSVAANYDATGVVDAMRHAAQLAPWEPGIVEQIIWVGTKHYGELSAADRAIVDGASERAGKLGLRRI